MVSGIYRPQGETTQALHLIVIQALITDKHPVAVSKQEKLSVI